MNITIPMQLDAPHRRITVGGEPMIFHCHHYNTFLQRSIEDASYIDSRGSLIGGAAEAAFAQLTKVFQEESIKDAPQRKQLAQEIYRWAGFGTWDLDLLREEGGTITTPNSHYARAWNTKFGRSDKPVCYFATGWLAGAMSAIYDRPLGAYCVEHNECCATDTHESCTFEVSLGNPNYRTFESVGTGTLTDHDERETPENNVDYDGIFTALTGMEIVGDSTGDIPAFGVHLTRHYANYYNRISFEFLKDMREMFDSEGVAIAASLFIEAGHVCAFNTFGGIMASSEWDALIKPSLKTKEDWVHGMVAAVNALGWGRWQVAKVSADEAEFVIHDDYESTGYQAMYGESDVPVSYLAHGAAVGIMNLVYEGNIEQKPTLDEDFYLSLFRGRDVYAAECTSSQAMGDEVTTFRVYRKS